MIRFDKGFIGKESIRQSLTKKFFLQIVRVNYVMSRKGNNDLKFFYGSLQKMGNIKVFSFVSLLSCSIPETQLLTRTW
jgi:hypothetical protein